MVVGSWKLVVGEKIGLEKTNYYLLTTIYIISPEDL
jgi:hypothetical protein